MCWPDCQRFEAAGNDGGGRMNKQRLSLPSNPLASLADEILRALPELMLVNRSGPSALMICEAVGADIGAVRRAMHQLNEEGRADLMRRLDSREQFLVPLRYRGIDGLRYCVNCGETFKPPAKVRERGGTRYSNRRGCSRACGIAWSWNRPGVRDRRRMGIAQQKRTPEALAKTAEINEKRWARSGERERMGEKSRRRWADPVMKANLARAIALVQRSPEMRKLYSDLRKQWWKDPLMREKMVVAMKACRATPEARAKFSELLKARWHDPVLRKKYLAAARANIKKMAVKNVGKRQSVEHVAARIASSKKTKMRSKGDRTVPAASDPLS